MEHLAEFAGALAWPVTVVFLVLVMKPAIASAVSRLKQVEAPTGWKVMFEMRRMGREMAELKSATRDLYDLNGEALRVREEIYCYIAQILKTVSPETAFEMRRELNRYHLSHLDMQVSQVKQMLQSAGFYSPSEGERDGLNSEITEGFIEAVLAFQERIGMPDADGVAASKTLARLEMGQGSVSGQRPT